MSEQRETTCLECIVTWLLFGDGALCLLCQEHVYWKGS